MWGGMKLIFHWKADLFISLKSLLRLVGFHVIVSVANKYMLKVNNRNTKKVVNYVQS